MAGSIGPYRIVRQLGAGGMGVVYEALDPGSGRRVALKTVRAVRRGALGSLRREIQALRSLEHPGIVRVLDEGVHAGSPWYAMELLEGISLREQGRRWAAASTGSQDATTRFTSPLGSTGSLRQESPRLDAAPSADDESAATRRDDEPAPRAPAPTDLASLLTVVRRLCAPLAYMHGRGVVHRDLKPENVLVRPGGHPVIVDFGLTVRFGSEDGRDTVSMSAETSGTLDYVSPEQARGAAVDARADLYALGCILFELLTGRPPFVGDTPMELLFAHARTPPPAPSTCAEGIPPELDALVLRLLAKEPRRRVAYADVVGDLLGKMGAERAEGEAPPARYLYRATLLGQGDALAELVRLLEGTRHGGGSSALLTGPVGSGKTRVALELVQRAQLQGVVVLLGDCPVGREGVLWPLRPFLREIADRGREMGEGEERRLLGEGSKVLAAFEPALLSPFVEAEPDPAPLTPDGEARRRNGCLEAALAALLDGRTGLLVVDDVAWADDMTLGFLDHLARSGRRAELPLLVLATARSLPDAVMPAARRIALPALTPSMAAEMCREMLATDELDEAFLEAVARQSAGNPAALSELLRAATEDGTLARVPGGSWRVTRPLPGGDAAPGLAHLLARRFARLTAPGRRLCQVAALLGAPASLELLASSVGQVEAELLADVLLLEVTGLLVEDAPGRIRIASEALREVARDSLQGEERAELHGRLAAALARLGDDTRLLEQAGHWRAAGDLAAARPCFRRAATAALARFALADAEAALRGFLELCDAPSPDEVAARVELAGEVLDRRGLREAARAEGERALRSAELLGDADLQSQALRIMGVAADHMGRLAEAQQELERAVALADEGGVRRTRAAATHVLGIVHFHRGDVERAAALHEAALELALDPAVRAMLLGNLAVFHVRRGRTDEARELYAQVLAEQPALSRVRATTLSNMALLETGVGRWEEAREHLQEAIETGRRLGDVELVAVATSNLADVTPLAEREPIYREGLRLARLMGDPRLEAHVKSSLAQSFQELRRPDEAAVLLDEAIAANRATGDRMREAFCRAILGSVRTDLQELEAAAAELHAATAYYREVGDPRMLGLVLIVQSRLARFRGEPEAGAALVREGIGHLQQAGDEVSRVKALGEEGHVALAAGRDGMPELARAREALAALRSPVPDAAIAVTRLAAAVEARAAGGELLAGELPPEAPSRQEGGST